MKDIHPLFVCVLGSFLLMGCGNSEVSNEALGPDENAALSKRIEAPQRPILIQAKALQPFTNQQLADVDVHGFRQYIHGETGNRTALLQFRKQLQLKPDQILVLGEEQPSQQPRLEFPHNDLFSGANDLVINHARMIKTPRVDEAKGEFENTKEYQQRTQVEMHKLAKATANIYVDLGRLEDALNYLAAPIRINLHDSSREGLAQYDADQQLMHIQASTTHLTGDSSSQLNLVFGASAKDAETILSNLRDVRDKRNYLGFIFSMSQGQLQLDQVILYQQNNIDERYLRLARIHPSQLYLTTPALNEAEGSKDLHSEQHYPLQQKLPFQFGLKHYRNPEKQKAEPELESRSPTDEELLQISLGKASSDAEGGN